MTQQFILSEVYPNGQIHKTGHKIMVDVQAINFTSLIREIFDYYKFTQYAGSYVGEYRNGIIYYSYTYPQEGTKITWMLIKAE